MRVGALAAVLVVIGGIVIVFIVAHDAWRPENPSGRSLVLDVQARYQTIPDGEMRTAIERIVPFSTVAGGRSYIQIAITSHHIPTAASFIANAYRQLLDSDGPRMTFVVIGPDHFERCVSRITVASRGFATSFGIVEIDERVVAELGEFFTTEQAHCLSSEHSIAAQAPFIARAFPDARIVGVTLSSSATPSDLKDLAAALSSLQDRITIIASIDFSHYLPLAEAQIIDVASARMIESLDSSAITLKHVDSPPTLRLVLDLARTWQLTPDVIDQKNLFDFTGQSDTTTGYINAVFRDPHPAVLK